MIEKVKLLKLTSDTLFKAFMMSKNTKNYKARLIHLIYGNRIKNTIDISNPL